MDMTEPISDRGAGDQLRVDGCWHHDFVDERCRPTTAIDFRELALRVSSQLGLDRLVVMDALDGLHAKHQSRHSIDRRLDLAIQDLLDHPLKQSDMVGILLQSCCQLVIVFFSWSLPV